MRAEVDEERIRELLEEGDFGPEETAAELARHKARTIAEVDPDAAVLGCDQVLEFEGRIFAKPKDMKDARKQLGLMNGRSHRLFSAAVLYEDGQPVWQFVGKAELHMRRSSDEFLDAYVIRNWPGIGETVGCYKIEEEGIRLFCRIDGDYFVIIGLPLLEILAYLEHRGLIPG